MAQLLARMERDGLIQRSPDPADRRSGEARLPDACNVLFQGNREALARFTDDEAAQLVHLVTRLTANLDLMESAETASDVPDPSQAGFAIGSPQAH